MVSVETNDHLTMAATNTNCAESTWDMCPWALGSLTVVRFVIVADGPRGGTIALNVRTAGFKGFKTNPLTVVAGTVPELAVTFSTPNVFTVNAANINLSKCTGNFSPVFVGSVMAGKVPDSFRWRDTPEMVTLVRDGDMLAVAFDKRPFAC